MPTDVITIENGTVTLISKGQDEEGMPTLRERKKISLSSLLNALNGNRNGANTRGAVETPVLPRDVRYYGRNGKRQSVVLEQLPQVRTLLWEGFGGEGVQLALPYIVYIFFFDDGVMPTYTSRLFFRNEPLSSLDDRLYYSFMTHVDDGRGHAVGGACFRPPREDPFRGTVAEQIDQSLNYYWSTQFRDYGEGSPWQGNQEKNRKANVLSGVKEWARRTIEDPLFMTELEWVDTKLTVAGVINEMLGSRAEQDEDRGQAGQPMNNDDLIDVIMRIR